MCQNVILAKRSRLIIWNLEVCYNLWVFRIGIGMTLVWTSLWDCLWLPASVIWFWVIVDRLTKSAPFIPVNTNYNVQRYAEIYIAHMLCLYGVMEMIISDWGSQFVAHFWEQLQASLRTHLIHNSAYLPQTDGQTEWVNQILKDMLRACVMENQGSWDKHLPLAEFSYNNNHQESLMMTPFEMLYGHRCQSHVKRAMQIRDVDHYSLGLEITYT
jgi:hypothetical protein